MKRIFSLIAVAAGVAGLTSAASISTPAHAAGRIPALAKASCQARNYQLGNCLHVSAGATGTLTNPGPLAGDTTTSLKIPSTTSGLEVTTNTVSSPQKIKHAAGAYTISAVDPTTNKLKKHYTPPMTLKVDPKYAVCSYDPSTGTCTPLHPKKGKYTITSPGTYVLVPKKYMKAKINIHRGI